MSSLPRDGHIVATSPLNLRSRSRIKDGGALSSRKASRSCWTIQQLLGWGPPTSQAQPEQAIPAGQLRSRVLASENADLLPQADKLKCEAMSRAEEGTNPRNKRQEKAGHRPTLHDSIMRKAGSCKSPNLRGNWIWAIHTRGRTSGNRLTPSPVRAARRLNRGWLRKIRRFHLLGRILSAEQEVLS